jgi:hypothetical protein
VASFFFASMSDDLDALQADVLNGQSTQIERDEAFCTRMRWAIAAGLESAPIGVITAAGTKNPKYIPTESTGVGTASLVLGDLNFYRYPAHSTIDQSYHKR